MNPHLLHAAIQESDDTACADLAARMASARDDSERCEIFRHGFGRMRTDLALYPPEAQAASVTLDSAAKTVRLMSADCLPLGLALVMHLYPLCAMQCAPLPRLSIAGLKRRLLMNSIRERSLIVANGGSERASGAHEPLHVACVGEQLRVTGTLAYVSLASVADLLFCSARMPDSGRTVFCAAGLRGETVRIGASRFTGSMRLSDTRCVSFHDHPVARGHYLLVENAAGTRCVFDYQRCWFHLLLADAYLARLGLVRRKWGLPQSPEHQMALNEVSCLREYARRLLDECRPHEPVETLLRVTSTLKLRVSQLAQSTSRQMRDRPTRRSHDGDLEEDAAELLYIRLQPTADDRILAGLNGAGLS
jgi:hypothetical protein